MRHPDRDERGRLLPGSTANPAGRAARSPLLRLVEAAEAVGAMVTITVPTRTAPRPPARRRPSDDTPPRAA